MQIGFDFLEVAIPSFSELADGAWNAVEVTETQLMQALISAGVASRNIAGPVGRLFAAGIEAAKLEQQHSIESYRHAWAKDKTFSVRGIPFKASAEAIEAFVTDCRIFAGSDVSASHGVEYKARTRPGYEVSAMYVEGVGSLIARRWDNSGPARLEFQPYRSSTFFASVKDDAHTIEASCALWCDAYCADKIAMAPKGVASVPTCVLEGRQYIITSISWGTVAMGDAWTFCRFADWTGPAYTYPERNKAADAGRVERGDYRGHIVMVKGQKCVIDGYAHVIGRDSKTYATRPLAGDEEVDQADAFCDDWEGEDVEE